MRGVNNSPLSKEKNYMEFISGFLKGFNLFGVGYVLGAEVLFAIIICLLKLIVEILIRVVGKAKNV
jgi:hypothetical protein